MVPWEGAPSIKLAEITKYHLDTEPGQPKMSNSIFVVAMNQAKYDSLPPDLKKVIDNNSGLETSKHIGELFDATTAPSRKIAEQYNDVFTTLTPAQYEKWKTATEPVAKEWIQEANAKGANGAALLEDARALIKKHGG